LYATCVVPSGRFTVPSEPMPLGAPAPPTVSGCHSCRQEALVQMNFPFCSPLRRYRVSPCASTSTVAPSFGFAAVLTVALEALPVDCDELGWFAGAEPELEDFELLPQDASASAAASAGTTNFIVDHIL
jgi:hypothetical protein